MEGVDTKAGTSPQQAAETAPKASDACAAGNKKLGKRMVALHTGYVGTQFKGSLVNRTLGQGVTIEHALEIAMHDAGMIADSNFGDFTKTHFSRASRTDKGVHSLGTVVALRAQLDDTVFLQDPEGVSLAESINVHLPPAIRVFSVQKVNRKFNARHMGSSRMYEYYVPAFMLGLNCDDSEKDRSTIELFRSALGLYVGSQPFHNFTKRQNYTPAARARNQKPIPAHKMAPFTSNAPCPAAADPPTAEPSRSQAAATNSAQAAVSRPPALEGDAAAAVGTSAPAPTSVPSISKADNDVAQQPPPSSQQARVQPGKRTHDEGNGPGPVQTGTNKRQRQGKDREAADADDMDVACDQDDEATPRFALRPTIRFLGAKDPQDPVTQQHYRCAIFLSLFQRNLCLLCPR